MKKIVIGIALCSLLGLSGCSRVTVPPGHAGKLLSGAGYSKSLMGTGKYWVAWWKQLVLLDETTHVYNQTFRVTMRDSDAEGNQTPGLTMSFEVSLRYRIKNDPAIVQAMFNDIKVDPKAGVTGEMIFNVYAAPTVETVFRDVAGVYTPEGAFANREKLSQDLGLAIQKRLSKAPIDVSDVLVKSVTLPPQIVKRIETTKDRELAIASERAQQAIEVLKRQNAIVLAQKDAERALIDAQAAAAQNRELAKGLTPDVLKLRELDIQKLYAEAVKARMESGDGSTVFMPFEAMGTTGAQMRMYQEGAQ